MTLSKFLKIYRCVSYCICKKWEYLQYLPRYDMRSFVQNI